MKIDLTFLPKFLDDKVYDSIVSYYNEFTMNVKGTNDTRSINVDIRTVCEINETHFKIVKSTGYNSKLYIVMFEDKFSITKVKGMDIWRIEHPYNSTEEMLFQASLVDEFIIEMKDIELIHKIYQRYM